MEPDFPCLAVEIAEPGPDMNIKVAAFTVIEKSINTLPANFFLPMFQDEKKRHRCSLYLSIGKPRKFKKGEKVILLLRIVTNKVPWCTVKPV